MQDLFHSSVWCNYQKIQTRFYSTEKIIISISTGHILGSLLKNAMYGVQQLSDRIYHSLQQWFVSYAFFIILVNKHMINDERKTISGSY